MIFDWSNYVKINNDLSNPVFVNSVVPQGLVLCPMVLNTYLCSLVV